MENLFIVAFSNKHYDKIKHIKHGSGDGPQVNIMDFLLL